MRLGDFVLDADLYWPMSSIASVLLFGLNSGCLAIHGLQCTECALLPYVIHVKTLTKVE